jgi:predicted dehydrogenase
LVSDDPIKLKKLSRKYGVEITCGYAEYESLMKSGDVDAVYIATPNAHHRAFVELAARHGIHVLCEKPLAVTSDDSKAMVKVCEQNNVKLMTAYRLHFDDANLKCIQLARSGKLGELRMFSSVFSFQIEDPENIRLKRDLGGGPLHDIGVYCINAARYLFQDEPTEVSAIAESTEDPRFAEIDEMIAVTMKFPDHRIANFTISFGAAASADYELVGTKGRLRLENAYEYSAARKLTVQIGDKKEVRPFAKHDQFAPELIYFSDCVLRDRVIEPSGEEGLIDVEIVEAIQQSIDRGRPVPLDPDWKGERPSPRMQIIRKGIREPSGVHVTGPNG